MLSSLLVSFLSSNVCVFLFVAAVVGVVVVVVVVKFLPTFFFLIGCMQESHSCTPL